MLKIDTSNIRIMKNRTTIFVFNHTFSHCNIATFLFLLFSIGWISAQQLTPFVVASSGGFYNNSSGMLSFTAGEMSAVETYTSPSAILTQGFQQTDELGTYIIESPDQNFSCGIYPNPNDGYFKLVTESDKDEHIVVKIMDVVGREIFQTQFYHQHKINVQSLDLSDAAQGIYLMVITATENNTHSPTSFFIEKIHIIR
jgi:Secretion system C-terminal sorting domain